jgi:hypothetical protein
MTIRNALTLAVLLSLPCSLTHAVPVIGTQGQVTVTTQRSGNVTYSAPMGGSITWQNGVKLILPMGASMTVSPSGQVISIVGNPTLSGGSTAGVPISSITGQPTVTVSNGNVVYSASGVGSIIFQNGVSIAFPKGNSSITVNPAGQVISVTGNVTVMDPMRMNMNMKK